MSLCTAITTHLRSVDHQLQASKLECQESQQQLQILMHKKILQQAEAAVLNITSKA